MTDLQKLKAWEQTVANIRSLTVVEHESLAEQEKRKKKLLKDPVAFAQYYLPKYASAPFGDFHIKIMRQVMRNDDMYLVAALAREHGKSVMMDLIIPLFEYFNGRMSNMLLVSHNETNAIELMMPLILNLEHNQRLINDFGVQRGYSWTEGSWKTKGGGSFRCIGAGQSPRGSRNEEKRPDFIVIDDIDTDEEVRNPERIKKKWNWIERALWPTLSVKGRKRFLFAGNIIGKDTCITRAWDKADFKIKVNILDENSEPSWPRYTKEQVSYMLEKMSYASAQQEYFNNPITEGTVFKDMRWGKVPTLSKFDFLLVYGDPSPSNSENKKGSYKCTTLMGCLDGVYYIIDCRLLQTGNSKFIQWYHDHKAYVKRKSRTEIISYHYMENNGLQDPFFKQVYQPLMESIGKARKDVIYITPDERKKPDKFTRIEGNLEPLHRNGKLIFNESERDNPHMKRMVEQFEAVEPTLSAHADGPDCVEGAVWVIKNKVTVREVKVLTAHKKTKKF
ncbi:MAG: hypothetical protein D6772_17035 [Bacteroidetes bacterium]|nr:MAG: hypothetical protein D6772_17035 [Bacteroidota bacterium]